MASTAIQAFVPGPIKKTAVLLPENVHYRKVILYKIRLRPGEPWYGSGGDDSSPTTPGPVTVPYNLDIDEAYVDGMSLRSHMRLRMTRILELVYGKFIYQESDQMQSTLVVQEVDETDWNRRRDQIWRSFIRWEGDGR